MGRGIDGGRPVLPLHHSGHRTVRAGGDMGRSRESGCGWETLRSRQGAIPAEVAARIKAKEDKRAVAETKRNAAGSTRARAG